MELVITREQTKVLVISVALITAVGLSWWWMSRPTAVALAMPTSSATPDSTAAITMSAYVVVDVVGAVRSPGVIHLPAGSRVIDAVDAAGGIKPGVQAGVNLARVLQDGEQIVVGSGRVIRICGREAEPQSRHCPAAGRPAGCWSGLGAAHRRLPRPTRWFPKCRPTR